MNNSAIQSCLTNPVPANKVVDVKIDWGCLTAPECTTLESSLQNLVNSICNGEGTPELDYHCLEPESNSLKDVLQSIINKICNVSECPNCDDDNGESSSGTIVNYTDLNLCLPDNFSYDTESDCLIPVNCDPDITNEEVVQSIISRSVRLSQMVKEQNEIINSLLDRVTALENVNNECDCCNLSNIETQVNTLTSQITDINTQIININSNCC